MSENIVRFESKIADLERDREKLIKDNISLIKENEYLKDQINYKIKEEHDKSKQVLIDKEGKSREIQALLESNLKTLEERCQLLEG